MDPLHSWLVVYTKSRAEKKFADGAERMGYEVYLPLRKERVVWSDRKKWVERPLIPSHVFVRVEPERRDELYTCPGFVRFLFWLKRPAAVRDSEITTLKLWLNDFDHSQIELKGFEVGARVAVQSGPLMGRAGVVTEHRGDYLQLYMEDLGLLVRVSLRGTQVSK